jgi:hypothetical protein
VTEPAPSVSTAPAEGASPGTASPRAPLGRRRLPPHLGPARTSTVLLAVAFVAIGVLYLFVKPPAPPTAGSATDPAPSTSRSVAPTTSAPAPPPPEDTPEPAETSAPTSEAAPTTTGTPPEDTEEGTVEETDVVPTPEETTAPAPETSAPEPTTAAPTS